MELTFSFSERSYSGQVFRPRPEIHIDSQTNLILVATPWGQRSSARKVIDRILEYFLQATGDMEATSPFEKLTCLSTAANHLRIATFLANDALFRDDNRTEYRSGVELFAASCNGNEFTWLQVGQPQLLLSRKSGHVLPLGGTVDLALDMSEEENLLPALPNQLLGLDTNVNLTINSFRAQPGDRLALISHSSPPASLYSLDRENISLDGMTNALAKAGPNVAFWLGLLELDISRNSYATEIPETIGEQTT